jgi:hypothetical protein
MLKVNRRGTGPSSGCFWDKYRCSVRFFALIVLGQGVSAAVVSVVVVTALVSLTSRLLFHVIWKEKPAGDPSRAE